jgi:predicted phosphodiesterase
VREAVLCGDGRRCMVEAMVRGASRQLRHRPKARPPLRSARGTHQLLVVADTHFGKYAWARSTGQADYDLPLASELVTSAAAQLIDEGHRCFRPARRTVAFLGDLFHYDSPAGATTSGTQLDRDGRLQKMIEVGADALLGIVERSAESCRTDVVIVNGNHDEALTWAFQRVLVERFAHDARVSVSGAYTSRQYVSHGGNLIGLAHGHRAKKRLPQVMALEAAAAWGQATYREIHTGHLHSRAAEWSRPIDTIDGVTVRIAPALCPADEWHAQLGFVHTPRAMESFFYRQAGGLMGMLSAGP